MRREEFLKVIDGMVFGDNPRQGFFKGTSFLHPDLAFQLDFPAGWKTANQPSAVLGLSEKQDAQVQLSLGGNTAPSDALKAFLAQQGVTPGPPARPQSTGTPPRGAPSRRRIRTAASSTAWWPM